MYWSHGDGIYKNMCALQITVYTCHPVSRSHPSASSSTPKEQKLDDRVARKQVGGREQIEGKKSEVTEDE